MLHDGSLLLVSGQEFIGNGLEYERYQGQAEQIRPLSVTAGVGVSLRALAMQITGA